MLSRVDRIQLAVRDRDLAAATFHELLGAEIVRQDNLELYSAGRTTLQAGESEIELLEPSGPGAVAEHLELRGEGIFAAGFATPDLAALASHLTDAGAQWVEEAGQLFLDPSQTRGMRTC
jgi:catechol 2,3-dioxygenase-like lactoylglutathione lyase family enzyme